MMCEQLQYLIVLFKTKSKIKSIIVAKQYIIKSEQNQIAVYCSIAFLGFPLLFQNRKSVLQIESKHMQLPPSFRLRSTFLG